MISFGWGWLLLVEAGWGWLVVSGVGGSWVVNDVYIGIDNCIKFNNLDGIGTVKQLKEKLKPSRNCKNTNSALEFVLSNCLECFTCVLTCPYNALHLFQTFRELECFSCVCICSIRCRCCKLSVCDFVCLLLKTRFYAAIV